MDEIITEKPKVVYRVCGENFLTLYAACYRLAKRQLVPEWFEQEDGGCKKDEKGNPIAHWSLHLIPTETGDAIPVQSEEEYIKHKEDCGFDTEKWVSIKRQRAKQISAEYRKNKSEKPIV